MANNFRDELARLYDHEPSDCERALEASPDFDRFRCKPALFICSCGRQWVHVCDEAEGCSWVRL